MALSKGKMTGLLVLCLCVIITSFVLAYGSGNVPGTTPSLNKKTKALIQAIVDSDAKPSTCEDLAKFFGILKVLRNSYRNCYKGPPKGPKKLDDNININIYSTHSNTYLHCNVSINLKLRYCGYIGTSVHRYIGT